MLKTALATLAAVLVSNPVLDAHAAPDSHASTAMQRTFPSYPGDATGRPETVTVQVAPLADERRRFALASTQAQRDDAPKTRVVDEAADAPRVHSGSPLFDALFAMALDDARLDSVSEIRDDAYNGGQPIPCRCFQTGEKWHYVWTRDLSYAANLGLAWLDPDRAVASLLFKTSGFRPGVTPPAGLPEGSTQIVQDTGSGGSWPVSTDRVTWAWGAAATLDALGGPARAEFAHRAYAALRGTLEADRLAAFDAASGLYGGEQSFLDWRTQTYAPWIVDNLSRMSGSRSLSTNVAHYQALRLAARLARELGDGVAASRYDGWADALRTAIDHVFWLDDVKQYASLATDDAVPLPLHKFDLLGTSLVILSGIAPPERAAEALARYPHAPFGAPVIAPQQPGVYVYHNRAIWPFVSAYELRAAAAVKNAAIASHAFDSLQRAAALNLSNMENLEWLTAKPRFDDGPAINSRRQLWSVAAYLSAVVEGVFGLHVTPQGLRVAPFLTAAARRALGQGDRATLSGFRFQDRALTVTLALPPMPAGESVGYYPLLRATLDGRPIEGDVDVRRLDDQPHRIELAFGPLERGDTRIARVPEVDALSHGDPRVFAPGVPALHALEREGTRLRLRFDRPAGAGDEEVRYDIHRDGTRVAQGLTALEWTDPEPATPGTRRCYAVEAIYARTGQHSHPSAAACFDEGAVQRVAPGDAFTLDHAGRVGFELVYDNHAHDITTGITNAVKVLSVLDAQGREVARGVVQMPHVDPRDGGHPLRVSTQVRATLPAGRYRATLEDFFNMSDLQSNATYGGPGGKGGPLNAAHVEALQVVALPPGP
jgi:hypothetical protein